MKVALLYFDLNPTVEANIIKDILSFPNISSIVSRPGLQGVVHTLGRPFSSDVQDLQECELSIVYRTEPNQKFKLRGKVLYRNLFQEQPNKPLRKNVQNITLDHNPSVRPYMFNTYDVPPPANYPGLAVDPYFPTLPFSQI